MSNVQVRLSKKSIREIDLLRNKLGGSRSEIIRKALKAGISQIKAEIALKDYLENKTTLCRAAHFSGMSVAEFAEYASKKGVPFYRYSAEEVEEDLKRLRKLHEDSA